MGKKTAAVTREVSDDELTTAVRGVVTRASGLAGSEFKKELAEPYKKLEKRALELARGLAARGELQRWASAKKERFFTADPLESLTNAVAKALAEGPLEEAELMARVVESGRGLGDLLKEWVKGAVGRSELFVHPPKTGSKKKRLGLRAPDPDVRAVFKGVFSALTKALATKDGARVSRAAVLAELAKALGFQPPMSNTLPPADGQASEDTRVSFMSALRELSAENVAQGLLPIRDLRARLHLDKQSFDRLSLELSRDGLVTLHHHDFPTSLSLSERQDMVEDERGTHYVGIALRRTHG